MTRGRELSVLSPRDIVRAGLCIGCGSCVARARAEADGWTAAVPAGLGDGGASFVRPAMALDRFGEYKPTGGGAWFRRPSAGFTRSCPFSPGSLNEDELAAELFPDAGRRHAATGRFRAAYVGAVEERDFRDQGSSGGLVSWTLVELLRTGLVDGVAHVVPSDPAADGRFFRYRISRTEPEIRAGARSRYYPVELSRVLDEIRARPGRYAVVGVPCFVKAVHLLRREDPVIRDRVRFTLGLFCGHMKSARMAESFAWQMGVSIDDVVRVEFRIKDPARPASTYTAELELRDGRVLRMDWWNLADGDWGSGFFQNAACNACDDVVAEIADVSFGDAWVDPYQADGRGTNVVVVRSPEIEALVTGAIREGRLALEPVDGDFVERTQAAGLRQRRQGLAYRLTWRRGPGMGWRRRIHPRKRVAPSGAIPLRRKAIYRTRAAISRWSHRVFWVARVMRRPEIFIRWGWLARRVYGVLVRG